MNRSSQDISSLPGGERMLRGLEDWRGGRTMIESCLVAIVFGKFRNAGLVSGEAPFAEAELVLYDLLRKQGAKAYGRYNSLIRELVSFGRTLARRERRTGLIASQ